MKQLLSRHATTVALVCAAVGAGVWFYVDRGAVTTEEAERRRGNVFPVWRADALRLVEIGLPGRKVTLKRGAEAGATWALELDGATAEVDALAVDRLLGTLEYATIKRRVAAESVDRPAFGLDAPIATVRLEMGDQRFELLVGGEASAPEGRYVELVGHGVFVAAKELGGLLGTVESALRARELVPYLSITLDAITLDGEGGARRLERAPWSGGRGGGFRFAEADPARAGVRVDADRLDAVFAAFSRMKAEPLLTPAEAAAASVPVVTIELRPREGEPAKLALGGACPSDPERLVLVRSAPDPLAGCVPKNVLPSLVRPAEQLEDHGLVGASVDEIAEIVIEGAGATVELARKDSGFVLKRPEERALAAEVGQRFLEALVAVRGERVAGAAPDGAAPADAIVVRVRATGGLTPDGEVKAREERIVLGPVEPREGSTGVRRARRDEDGATFEVGEDAARAFTSAALLLRDRRLVDTAPESFRELTLVDGKRRQKIRLGADGAPDVLLEPVVRGLGPDPFALRELRRRLGTLEAVRWIAARDDGGFGLERPRVEVAATYEGEDGKPRDLRLVLGAQTDEGPYASIDGKPEVFIAPKELERSVTRWVLDTTRFVPAPADVDRLEARTGGHELVVERDGARLVTRVDGKPAAESITAELREAIVGLRPLSVVSIGAPEAGQGLDAPVLSLTVTPRRGAGAGGVDEAPYRITIGAGDTREGLSVHYARREGVDASFAVPQSGVRPFLELLGD